MLLGPRQPAGFRWPVAVYAVWRHARVSGALGGWRPLAAQSLASGPASSHAQSAKGSRRNPGSRATPSREKLRRYAKTAGGDFEPDGRHACRRLAQRPRIPIRRNSTRARFRWRAERLYFPERAQKGRLAPQANKTAGSRGNGAHRQGLQNCAAAALCQQREGGRSGEIIRRGGIRRFPPDRRNRRRVSSTWAQRHLARQSAANRAAELLHRGPSR